MTRARHYNTMIAICQLRRVNNDLSNFALAFLNDWEFYFPHRVGTVIVYKVLLLVCETKVTRFIIRKMMRRKSERAMKIEIVRVNK